MKFRSYLVWLMLVVVCLVSVSGAPPVAFAAGGDEFKEWRPIDQSVFNLREPVVEKDADAEALFWEVRMADEIERNLDSGTVRTVLDHYVRIKVFTERGRESQSKVDIPFGKNEEVKDIAARTVKPNGQVVELRKEDIFERTIVKVSGTKIKAKSFAMPSVEPGSVIEYRWREIRNDDVLFYERLPFQRDIPVQRVKYYIKPLDLPGFGMRYQTFHGQGAEFVKEKNGFWSTTMTNMPALHEEPRMPPEDEVRTWTLLFYTPADYERDPNKFWAKHGKLIYDKTKKYIKASNEVQQAATTAIGNATTDEEKLQRLFNFCKTQIKNTGDDASGISDDERAKLKANKSPADTLKRGMGSGPDIDLLFAALATAAGFEARVVNSATRDDVFFDKNFASSYFISTYNIAVRVGNEWRFFDPGSTYVPYGMLLWSEEGQESLVSDPKEPTFVKTPMSPPEKSQEKRMASFKLSEDGTLEGDVRIEYTGHFAIEKKEEYDDDSPAEREQALRDMLKAQMSTAEVTNVKIENVTDPAKPFIYAYHVKVPGYAQRTGKRLFLQPAFFQHGVGPLFTTSERRYPVYFHYPWSESDGVTIELPAGYTLDNPDRPAPFAAGDMSKYDVQILTTKDGRKLIYKRKFFFGAGGAVYFPTQGYAQLKQYFDALNKSDNHTITLKQSAEAAPAPSN
ncbi:MAG TPA: DUF3857 domain-containing protein [Pyrinomonadaceae bacterium]|jgi:hypothetical protein